jgi:hypothetical protein
LKFKLGRKLIKIFRSTVIIGTKIPKQRLFMITELNIYAALVLAGLLSFSVRLGVSLYQAS